MEFLFNPEQQGQSIYWPYQTATKQHTWGLPRGPCDCLCSHFWSGRGIENIESGGINRDLAARAILCHPAASASWMRLIGLGGSLGDTFPDLRVRYGFPLF